MWGVKDLVVNNEVIKERMPEVQKLFAWGEIVSFDCSLRRDLNGRCCASLDPAIAKSKRQREKGVKSCNPRR